MLRRKEGYRPVSIHAPIKDATVNVRYDALNMPVSIHAPIKDATPKSVTIRVNLGFNPRTHKGCDFMPMMFPIQTKMFQSTHP